MTLIKSYKSIMFFMAIDTFQRAQKYKLNT